MTWPDILGLSGTGPWYAFWSGIAGDVSLFGVVVTLYVKHNCHVRRCPRIGRVQVGEHVVCRRHHPADAPNQQDVHTEWIGGNRG